MDGMLYGVPSFMTGRVADKNTGMPLQDAATTVWSLGSKVSLQTNAGGWFNIAENGQKKGWYLLITRKDGYRTSFKLASYSGEPLDMTIQLTAK